MSIYQQDQNNKVLCVGVQLSRVESWIEPDPPLIFCAMCSCLQREGFIVLGRICLIVKDLFLEILAFTIYKTLQNSCLFTASCHAGTTATVFNIKYSIEILINNPLYVRSLPKSGGSTHTLFQSKLFLKENLIFRTFVNLDFFRNCFSEKSTTVGKE
ncbi:hypothetical protein H8356DRAFT_1338640 [Neocallimastix lanati (nom. inval.)]|nr:hypothetical protein H8356DRAFT_1338640 [Neocallimastix sp. JGI-2020a]